MRKALRIIAITSGIISAVSALVLGVIYLEDMLGFMKKLKGKVSGLIRRRQEDEMFEVEE
ncbi:MAG: hypothetical protein IKU57_03585 [Oscillospiraceae bacterium]|nr:hypothetical protein [Oscillospiraceae bacterium]